MTKLDIAFFVLLTIISGIRYGVGTDFFNYNEYYELISSGYNINVEPGFVLISSVLSKLGFNSQAMFFALSALTMVFFYHGIKYYINSDYAYKPVLYIIFIIFPYFSSFNVVRQVLAASIILYASKYIIEKKLTKFSIWVLFAMLFHFSSIIFLGLYFIAKRDFKRTTLLSVLLISFVAVKLDFIMIILKFIINHLSFLDFGGYIQNYINSSYNTRELSFGAVFFIHVTILVMFILLKDKLIKNERSLLSFNFFYLYILFYILSMGAPVLTRFNYYFSIYMAISISKFGLMFDGRSRKIVEYVVTVLYLLLFMYIVVSGYLNPGTSDNIPYNFNLDFFNS